MATISNTVRGKHEPLIEEAEEDDYEEEEEEALSLCDLPDILIKQEDLSRKPDSHHHHHQEEFDFRLWSEESEMCVADEIFFQGQILPLRKFKPIAATAASTGLNRSGSTTDHSSTGSEPMSRSYSSRSSSISSSSSSTATNNNNMVTNAEIPKLPRMPNHFHHTHYPSPKPQPKVSNSKKQVSFGNNNNNNNNLISSRKSKSSSSAWDFFRLGVVPAPEIIALQDLKVRCSTNNNNNNSNNNNIVANRNSVSSNSSSSHRSSHHSDKRNDIKSSFKQLVGKGMNMSGCKCSIETVPYCDTNTMMMMKKKKTESSTSCTTTHAMKEKVVKQRQKQGMIKKVIMSRRRTFEWIKELSDSHATYGYYPNEEEANLLSNTS